LPPVVVREGTFTHWVKGYKAFKLNGLNSKTIYAMGN
jgi:hypothetical protein